MARVYTIKEAIGKLDAIRMEANQIPSLPGTLSHLSIEASKLISELASVVGWLARHIDQLEAELVSDISFECDDGSVKKSELFEVATLDGENAHPGMKRR